MADRITREVTIVVRGNTDLKKLQTALRGLSQQTAIYEKQVKALGNSGKGVAANMNAQASAAANLNRSTKSAALGIQNAGYQISDFAVQVTGGTSAIRAFSQQAPQLLAGFGQFGPKIAIAVAAFSTLAALAPTLIKIFKDTKEVAEDTAEAIQGLVGDYKDFTDQVNVATGSVKALAEQQRQIVSVRLAQEITKLSDAIASVPQITPIDPTTARDFILFNSAASNLAESLKVSGQEAKTLVDEIIALQAASNDVERFRALDALRQAYGDVLANSKLVTEEQRKIYAGLIAAAEAAGLLVNVQTESVLPTQEDINAAIAMFREAQQRIRGEEKQTADERSAYVADFLNQMRALNGERNQAEQSYQNRLRQTVQYNKDIASSGREVADRNREISSLAVEIKNNTNLSAREARNLAAAIVNAEAATGRLSGQAAAAAGNMVNLANAARSAAAAIASMAAGNIALGTQIKAQERFNDVLEQTGDALQAQTAKRKELARAEYESALNNAAISSGPFGGVEVQQRLAQEYQKKLTLIDKEAEGLRRLEGIQTRLNEAASDGGGGGGGASAVDDINKEWEKLLSMLQGFRTPAEEAAEKLRDLKKAASGFELEGENLKLYTRAVEELEEQAKGTAEELKSLAEGWGASFGTALGDIVTGTKSVKEAFKEMAASILADIARIAATNFLTNLLTGSSNAIFDPTFGAGRALPRAGFGITPPQPISVANLSRAPTVRTGAGAASGGQRSGPMVVVNNNAAGTEARAETRDGRVYVTVDEVRSIVSSDIARGGNPVAKSIENTYSMSRVRR